MSTYDKILVLRQKSQAVTINGKHSIVLYTHFAAVK